MLSYSVLSTISTKLASIKPTAKDVKQPVISTWDPSEGLNFHEVTFLYPNSDKPILHESCVSFPVQSRTAVVAPSGTGKSTVMNLIKGFLVPTSGYITLHGVPLCSGDNRRIGFVCQQPQIFNTTVWENIGYGCSDLSREEIEATLREGGLYDILSSIGLELDQRVGKGGGCLSGGQKQVVQLLRVLITDPDVLLLDEPSAALDDTTREIIMELIVRSMGSRIIILVTHDQDMLQYVDRVLHL